MKKKLLILSLFVGIGSVYSQNVNIPDANFKTYLVGNASINTNMDTEIQVSEANAFTGLINCPSQSISDLTGIEEFTSLTGLYCYNNFAISSIDVSMMPNLQQLFCSSNAITQLDVSNNPNLVFLACDDNELTSLNVANGNNVNIPNGSFYANSNPNLTCIEVDDAVYSTSNWTNIDAAASFSENCNSCIVIIPDANFKAYLVGNPAINANADTEIQCTEAFAFNGAINVNLLSISDLTGIEAFVSLTTLDCSNNQLTTLDLSSNNALTSVSCFNNQLTSLNLTGLSSLANLNCLNNQLSNLNLSTNTALYDINCNANQITSLDLSQNNSLGVLRCADNLLSSIDLSANTNLVTAFISGNIIASLDLSNNLALINLECHWNNLTSLDVSNNTNLMVLRCYNNVNITSLDLSNNSALYIIQCQDNMITDLNVANGNNTAVTSFNATGIPATCIQVDDATYSTTNWTNIDVTASFSENCIGTSAIQESELVTLSIYPNPVSSNLIIETEAKIENIEIFNINGSMVQNEKTNNFSVASLTNGIYFIHVKTNDGIVSKRFIKE